MGRLIDADELLAIMQKACERERGYGTPLAMMHWFMNIIVGQPTAYDVDAVAKELEALVHLMYLCMPDEIVNDFKQKAIEIVRKGGVKNGEET